MGRIRAAVGITLFVDSALYLAVVPFLPYYADEVRPVEGRGGHHRRLLPGPGVLVVGVPTGALAGRYGGAAAS